MSGLFQFHGENREVSLEQSGDQFGFAPPLVRSAARAINWLKRSRKCASRRSSMLSERSRISASNCSLTRVHSFALTLRDMFVSAFSAVRLIGAQRQSVSDALLRIPKPTAGAR